MPELEVEDRTPHHWVASTAELVVVVVYEGSHEDVRHVTAGSRAVERRYAELKGPVRLMFVVPPMLGRAPTAEVRTAIAKAARRLEATVSHAALVVLGTGFGPALHRSAATGLITLLRPKTLWKINASVPDGLTFLLGRVHPEFDAIEQRCEQELRTRPGSRWTGEAQSPVLPR